ncbi:hypothetical protein Leryth_024079 [Lithospermum erythrorhizon]|nr:hypothetical protein Leryth_024079 [Lithospermum erythrorhizon]
MYLIKNVSELLHKVIYSSKTIYIFIFLSIYLQALIALKKGTQLIKYSRKGKPKFCPFRLSPDETTLIWYSHGQERNLKLNSVQRIIPGQRTAVFKRFVRPEKEYLSFSLIYNNGDRSLDLVNLISPGQHRSRRTRSELSDLQEFGSDYTHTTRLFGATLDFTSSIQRGRASVDSSPPDSISHFPSSDVTLSDRGNMQMRTSYGNGFRLSVSSNPSSQGSGPDDIESLGDVYMWGEVWFDGVSIDEYGNPNPGKNDVLIPKPLESNVVLDVHQISCGVRHVALVTRQGEIFTWGEESGGRLGHGIEKDFSRPRLIESLAVTSIDFVACGEHHTCAITQSGDLFTWGDGTHNAGLLGHGNDVSHWIPKRIEGIIDGVQVLSIACGAWHSALTTSNGKLFTFGDGTFGVLGHGDRESITNPKEVQSLSGSRVIKVACGLWHTAAIVEVANQNTSNVSSRKLFSWGDGDKNRLGHGCKDTYLVPTCVSSLIDYNFHQLECGHNMTIALTTSGHVFTMGSNANGQLGNPQVDGKLPCLVQDRLVGEYVEEIACGSSHVAALTSRSEVFTWGEGANGRLGHGDTTNRNIPTLVEGLKDKHVKNIACGSNFTSCICIHKWVSDKDQSACTACRQPFGFTRKRHNCCNCGLVHCGNCSSKKAMKAALAPTPGKPHRVCDTCYLKLKKAADTGTKATYSRKSTGYHNRIDSSRPERVASRTSRNLLSPTMEPVKYLEIKSAKYGPKPDYSIVRASQVPSLLQLKDIAFPSSLSALQSALKPGASPSLNVHQPQQQHQSPTSSRPTSPYARRPSPPRSITPVFSRGVIDSLKRTNELLNQEVSSLETQMKKLKKKCEVQDVELQKIQQNAAKAVSSSMEISSASSTNFEAMKTIASQLKEMTDNLYAKDPQSETIKSFQSQVETIMNNIETQQTLVGSSSSQDNHKMADHHHMEGLQDAPRHRERTASLFDGSEVSHPSNQEVVSELTQARKSEGAKEVIEQFEPGVYVTLLQLTNGTKIFKRVRFSKRRFSEQQANEWWSINRDRVTRRYNARINTTLVESVNTTLDNEASTSSVPATTDEHNETQ